MRARPAWTTCAPCRPGPLCPLVLAVTSVHDQLHLGFAFRTSAFSREAVDALAATMLGQADALRAVPSP